MDRLIPNVKIEQFSDLLRKNIDIVAKKKEPFLADIDFTGSAIE